MADELIARLLASASVTSMSAERKICTSCRRQGWVAHQGVFYIDPNERKLRELDVLCRSMWARSLRSGDQVARLSLLIEAKSIVGYHILFAECPPDSRIGHLTRFWPGFEDHGKFRWLARALREAGLPEDQLPRYLTRFRQLAFPGEMAVARGMFPDPPAAHATASAFRETNIGGEKGPENSVLWRAVRELRSVAVAIRRSSLAWHCSWIAGSVEAAITSGRDPMADYDNWVKQQVRVVDVVHPIVVLDSQLWLALKSGVVEVPWCRFLQLGTTGSTQSWCDVVSRRHFSSFIATTTRHYARFYKRTKSRRSRS